MSDEGTVLFMRDLIAVLERIADALESIQGDKCGCYWVPDEECFGCPGCEMAQENDELFGRATDHLLRMLRGGYPEKCDFCGKAYEDGRYPVPEEAGDWACSECAERWERQERHDPA